MLIVLCRSKMQRIPNFWKISSAALIPSSSPASRTSITARAGFCDSAKFHGRLGRNRDAGDVKASI
jgi:hypothetical protein